MSGLTLRSSRQSLLIALGLALGTIAAGTAASRLGAASPVREPSSPLTAPVLAPAPSVTFGEPELTSETAPSVSLAALVGRSLASAPQRPGRTPSSHRQGPKPIPVATNSRWICGPWQELWQGHGDARSCEWR
jgi:hypothetical protein